MPNPVTGRATLPRRIQIDIPMNVDLRPCNAGTATSGRAGPPCLASGAIPLSGTNEPLADPIMLQGSPGGLTPPSAPAWALIPQIEESGPPHVGCYHAGICVHPPRSAGSVAKQSSFPA